MIQANADRFTFRPKPLYKLFKKRKIGQKNKQTNIYTIII